MQAFQKSTLITKIRSRLIVLLALLFNTFIVQATPDILLPKHRLLPDELAIVINDSDPLSRRIGNYYQKVRNIPPENVLHVRIKPGHPTISEAEFSRLYQQVQKATPPGVQAYALTWAAPWRVGCMSITTAFTFGLDRAFCSKTRCARTRVSPLYNSKSVSPYDDFGMRPTIAIAATSFEQAKALIDRGVASDNTQPPGTAWLVSTTDKARNVRSVFYPVIVKAMAGWIDTRIVKTDALENVSDILFYFTGRVRVTGLQSLQFRPGAIADHLTSTGGQLTTTKQMSALRWLEAGATGSYGTVVEPCNLIGKFPRPGLVMEAYGSGRTLIEAYWQSIQQPGEGIVIGEPLAAPFDGQQVEEKDDYILLTTRTLMPGLYRLLVSSNSVGPFKQLPGVLKVNYHQETFQLPKSGGNYYRLELIGGVRYLNHRTPSTTKEYK